MNEGGAATNEDGEPKGTFGQFLGCVALVLSLGAVVALVVWAGAATFSSDTLVHLALSDEPSSASFTLEQEAVVEVWAIVDLRHAGISPSTPHASLPHVLDYVVTIRRGEAEVVSARCNPFDSDFARTSHEYNSIGAPAGRMYDGLVRACRWRLGAGEYVVVARREWVGRDERLRFDRTEVVVRVD